MDSRVTSDVGLVQSRNYQGETEMDTVVMEEE